MSEGNTPFDTRRSPWKGEISATFVSAKPRNFFEGADRTQALRALAPGRVVYALRLTDGVVKIGCTGDLAQRRHSYPGSTVLGFMPGTMEDEKAIHDGLTEHRVRGREYYYPHPDVLTAVNAMRDHWNLPHIAA